MCCKLNLGCKRTAQLAFFWPLPEVLVKVRGCLELHFWPLHLKVGSKAETPPFQCQRLRSATGRPLELQCLLLSLVSSLGRLCQGGVSYFAVSKVISENFIQTTVAPSSRVACLSKSQCGKFPRKAELWCWQSRCIPNSWEQFCFFFLIIWSAGDLWIGYFRSHYQILTIMISQQLKFDLEFFLKKCTVTAESLMKSSVPLCTEILLLQLNWTSLIALSWMNPFWKFFF